MASVPGKVNLILLNFIYFQFKWSLVVTVTDSVVKLLRKISVMNKLQNYLSRLIIAEKFY